MIRLYIPGILLLASFVVAQSQTVSSDTISETNLHEIVVEASMQRTGVSQTTYFPSANQKKLATDAISLLSQMAIPQLEISHENLGSISTLSGKDVSIYINYVPAAKQDLIGMRTKDVLKVEYLINPSDPRFGGSEYVVNFIMRKYESGGYTKIAASKSFGLNEIVGTIYSKFAYKSMSYDLFADENHLTDRHWGSSSMETFDFPNLSDAGPVRILRTSTPISSRYRSNANNITFRALYDSPKARIINTLSFNNTNAPHNDSKNFIEYGQFPLSGQFDSNNTSNLSKNLSYTFDSHLPFSTKFVLNIDASYQYVRTDARSEYKTDEFNVVNNARESSHIASFIPRVIWNPTAKCSIEPLAQTTYYKALINYTGNSPSRQYYEIWGHLAAVKGRFKANSWNAAGFVGWVFENSNFSGTSSRFDYIQTNLRGSYAPNDKHQFEISGGFNTFDPDMYQRSPNMLQQDRLMWYAGSPNLKTFTNYGIDFDYVWLPNNKWQLAASSSSFIQKNPITVYYSPAGPMGTMLRKYVNGDRYASIFTGISVTGKFLDNKLIANLSPKYWYRESKGYYNQSLNDLVCIAQLTWYFGNCYLSGWYRTPYKFISGESGTREWYKSSYQVVLGWSVKSWQAKVTARNFFRSSWEYSRQEFRSRYYDFDKTEYGSNSHMRFIISLTYTVGYGKKVRKEETVNGIGTASSAILR